MLSGISENQVPVPGYTARKPYLLHKRYAGSLSSLSAIAVSQHYGTMINGYYNQYNSIVNTLHAEKSAINNRLAEHLATDNSYIGMRNEGVRLAWKYEQADAQMGGVGSTHWNQDQIREIQQNGQVRGAQGHHINNVADHPEHQANPDNIRFYKDQQAHLQEGHNGNFQNESSGSLIDKDAMLAKTNQKRVLAAGLKGCTIAAVVGSVIGTTVTMIAELARVGIADVDMHELFKISLKAGIETGAIAATTYAVGQSVSRLLENAGLALGTNLGSAVQLGSGVCLLSLYRHISILNVGCRGWSRLKHFL